MQCRRPPILRGAGSPLAALLVEGLVAREVDHLLRVLLRQVAAEQHRADMCTRHAVVEPYRAELFEFLANSKKRK